jgi:hypothetical protein
MCIVQSRAFVFLVAGPVRVTVNSGPSALLVWLSVIGTAAAVAAVFFAWRAAVSARDANRYARETAQAAEEANAYARQTAEISREASAYTRETVEVAKAAHEADERNRRLTELQEIGRLVESIFWQAGQVFGGDRFRVAEQNQLAQALIGIDPPMPRCAEILDAATGGQVYGAATQDRVEVEIALRNFRASAPKEASAPSPPASA